MKKKKGKNSSSKRIILVGTMMICIIISMSTYWIFAYKNKYGYLHINDKIISYKVSDYAYVDGNIIYLKNIDNKIANDFKDKQLDIIKNNNPVNDDYHTWIRNVEDIKNREITSNSRISQKSSNNMTDEQLVNAISELLKNEKQENLKINMDIVPNVELKYNINSNNQVQQNSINQQEKQNKSENMQLVVKEENEFIQEKRMNIIKKFWKKIVKLFKSKNSTERIGE